MKVRLTLLSLVFAGLVFAAMPAGATQEAAEKKDAPAAQKENPRSEPVNAAPAHFLARKAK